MFLTRLFSAMDFRFDFVTIFLILDVASVRSQGRFSKNSDEGELSSGIANNPFLRSNFPNVQNNPFLSNNSNGNPSFPNIVELQQENPFPNIETNPFLKSKTPTRMGTQSTISPRPTTTQSVLRPGYPDIPMTSISERKCDEYIGEIWGTNLVSSLNKDCGGANRLIVGGTEAQVGEFPHMVALGKIIDSNDFDLTCGGTLISHAWVLSAAHCAIGNNIPTHAGIGFHRLSDQNTGIRITIKDIIVHEEYKAPAMYADIALVQLMNSVTFSTSIQPACLYQRYDKVPKKVWATGWGITEYAGEQTDELQKVQLDVINQVHCTFRHNTSADIPDGIRSSMLCAGDRRSYSRDTCQGDSGGPLQIYSDNKCLFQVIGITSFGPGCASGLDIPAVYTRVPNYVSWIEENVWPQGR